MTLIVKPLAQSDAALLNGETARHLAIPRVTLPNPI